MFYAPLTTAALFTAIILEDAISRNSENIINNIFLGILSVWLMLYLSFNGANYVAWGILVLPMFVIILSYILTLSKSETDVPKRLSAANPTGYSMPAANPTGYSMPAASPTGYNMPRSSTSMAMHAEQSMHLPMGSSTPSINIPTIPNVTPNVSECTS